MIAGKMSQGARAVVRRISYQPFRLLIFPARNYHLKDSPDEYDHFTSRNGGGIKILSNEEISKMIDKTIKIYKEANCGYAFSSTGDTFVAVFQTDEENIDMFLVMVSKDHYEYDFVNGE